MRVRLEELEASQLGGKDFMNNFDDAVYESTKVRNPVFGFWRSLPGLPDPTIFKPADPSRVRQHRDRFDQLMTGE
jgi:hypothetical protein